MENEWFVQSTSFWSNEKVITHNVITLLSATILIQFQQFEINFEMKLKNYYSDGLFGEIKWNGGFNNNNNNNKTVYD